MTRNDANAPDAAGAHRHQRSGAQDDRAAYRGGDGDTGPDRSRDAAYLYGPEPVARRTATGWRVGDEEVSDLTSAMVLADLLAEDLPAGTVPQLSSPSPVSSGEPGGAGRPVDGARPARDGSGAHRGARVALAEETDPKRLQETVAQLEHALTARVRVEQAIGVLAERHRLRPRQAFELLRSVARARGRRVLEIATEVVESATNPLLRIPEELAKPPVSRRRGRVARHTLGS
jgi:hypothetical protein